MSRHSIFNLFSRRTALISAVLITGLLPLVPAQAFSPISKPAPKTTQALFTFDTLTDGTDPAFSQAEKGLTGTFDAPGAEVQHVNTPMPGFSGNFLFLPHGDLQITFDKPVSEVSLDFIDVSYLHPTTITLAGGGGSVSGFGSSYASFGPVFLSSGVLDWKASSPFTQITLGSTGGMPIAIDNLKATVAPVPEASTVITFGALLALGGIIVFARRKTLS